MIEIIGFFTILARLQEISHTLSLAITEILSYSSHPSAQRQDRDGSGVGATSPLLAGVPLSSSSFESPAWGGPEVIWIFRQKHVLVEVWGVLLSMWLGNCYSGSCKTGIGWPSIDGSCGPMFAGNKACPDSGFGDCCSIYGYCGSGDEFCLGDACYSGICT
jgi:hypothetical protein